VVYLVDFHSKNPNLGIFEGSSDRKYYYFYGHLKYLEYGHLKYLEYGHLKYLEFGHLVYFIAIWYILWLSGIVCIHVA
jgi:hypothetical protein